jgi:hypothetical protein
MFAKPILINFEILLTMKEKREKGKTIKCHWVLKPVRNDSPFSLSILILDSSLGIKPVFRIDKIK